MLEFYLGGGQGRMAAVPHNGGGCLCGMSRPYPENNTSSTFPFSVNSLADL